MPATVGKPALTVDTASLIPLPSDTADDDYDGADGQHWFCVIFAPRITVRKMPNVKACAVATADIGEILEVAAVRNGWARLTDAEAARRGVFQCDEAWALIDGRSLGKDRLLQPCLPRFFRVVGEPYIPLLDGPTRQAPGVAIAETGEVLEIMEARYGWVRLTEAEAYARGVPEDVQAWALFNSSALGLVQLLEPCFVPVQAPETVGEEKENVVGNELDSRKNFEGFGEGIQDWLQRTRFGNMIPNHLELAKNLESEALMVHTRQENELPIVPFSSIFQYQESIVCFFERQFPKEDQDLPALQPPLQMVGNGYQMFTPEEGFQKAYWIVNEGKYARLAKSWTSLTDLLGPSHDESPLALLDDDSWIDVDLDDPPEPPRTTHLEPSWEDPDEQTTTTMAPDTDMLFNCVEII